jgi:CHAT domain-containing protein
MSLAGYRHVIGTLWSIEDSLAPFVAKAVYAALTQNGTADAANAATALHATQNALRTMRPDAPSLWAPYIHVGP